MQVSVESARSQKILNVMQSVVKDEMTKKIQVKRGYQIDGITYDPEKKVLIATDGFMMFVWKVNDERLLAKLSKARSKTLFKYEVGLKGCYLMEQEKNPELEWINVASILPKHKKYIKIKDFDVQGLINRRGFNLDTRLLELAVLAVRARFRPWQFTKAVEMTENWDVFEFSESKVKPCLLKCNEDRMIALMMPLLEEKIIIHERE